MAGAILMATVAAIGSAASIDQSRSAGRAQTRESKKALFRQESAQRTASEDARSKRKQGEMEQKRLKKKRPGVTDEDTQSGGGLDSTFLTPPVAGEGGSPLLGGSRSLGGR